MNTKKILNISLLIIFLFGFILLLNFSINQAKQRTKTIKTENQKLPNLETKNSTKQNTKSEEQYYYFAYGSNMDIDMIRSRTSNQEINAISPAYINNYKLTFPRGVGNIEQAPGETLWGCLFLLDKNDIYDLDTIEGYKEGRINNSYDRKTMSVTAQDGKTYQAYVYIQPMAGDDKTSQSYKDTLIKGSIDCRLPINYTKKLRNTKTY